MATILIVDDEPANRLLLAQLVRHAGHTPIEAQSACEALDAAKQGHVNLAIVDLFMPGMSGTELIKAFRNDSRLRDLPVILHTATCESAAMGDFMQLLGIRYVIPKPCEPAEALAILESAVNDVR